MELEKIRVQVFTTVDPNTHYNMCTMYLKKIVHILYKCSVVYCLKHCVLPRLEAMLHRSKVRAKNGQSICHGEGYTIGCLLGAWPAFTYRLAA